MLSLIIDMLLLLYGGYMMYIHPEDNFYNIIVMAFGVVCIGVSSIEIGKIIKIKK